MADIEHSQIPSEHCHEPKGAPEAAAGTVYVADGAGSGSFIKIPLSSLDTSTQSLTDVDIADIDDTEMVKATSLTQLADGTLKEVTPVAGIPLETFETINKNTAELYRIYLNQTTINQSTKMAVEDALHKINEIIAALKNWGIAE
jgi:hypothetical protein